MTDALKPCPFCGDTPAALHFGEGSTYRWLAWSCPSCGVGSEERVQTWGDGRPEQWLSEAKARCITAWNRRAALAAPPVGWVLVPVEPTLAMQQAAMDASRAGKRLLPDCAELWASSLVYAAMLAAAPGAPDAQPPARAEGE